jgi:hypothetical protein
MYINTHVHKIQYPFYISSVVMSAGEGGLANFS